MAPLTLPTVASPHVTVQIVTYGNWSLTWRTLQNLVAHTDPCYEVVIVDNASPDATPRRLVEEVRGARIVLNEQNVGFGAANNQAARLARAPNLLFLNTDAFVHEGWLVPLLSSFEDKAVGAAGPMFLHEDGRLQEAGSVLFREGWTHAVGDGQDPQEPEYRFPRFTDYISGGCLLVRREAFEEAGGFDPVFFPAYYEDVDLCLRLWRNGWKVRYEPRSVITHVRGGSSPDPGSKTLYEKNRTIFADRWKDLLSHRPPYTPPDRGRRRRHFARDIRATSRILVLSERVPGPDSDASDPIAFRILEDLAAGYRDCRVSALTPGVPGDTSVVDSLLSAGIEMAVGVESPAWWMNERRFHYDVVILAGRRSVQMFHAAVRAWQPQAARIETIRPLSAERLRVALAEAGVAPTALVGRHRITSRR